MKQIITPGWLLSLVSEINYYVSSRTSSKILAGQRLTRRLYVPMNKMQERQFKLHYFTDLYMEGTLPLILNLRLWAKYSLNP